MRKTLAGEIEQISFYSAGDDYTVARLRSSGTAELVTVVGHLSGIREGEYLRLTGFWKQHPRFGRQFAVEFFESVYPETVEGIEKYLGSGLIKGIGPKTAERIVACFGLETLDVIDKDPDKLRAVNGLGAKKISVIRDEWDKQQGIRRLMIFLQGYGIGGALAVRIYRQYREKGIEVVSRNPYRLAEEVRGIGFATADRIAESLGLARDSTLRITSGLVYVAELAGEKGHSCCPRDSFLKQAAELLELDEESLEPVFSEMAQAGNLVLEQDDETGREYVYSSRFFWAEKAAAEGLARIAEGWRGESVVPGHGDSELSNRIEGFERKNGIELSSEQKDAIKSVLLDGVAVVTGGPGTGKTTIIAALISMLEVENLKVTLAAPTGRAAKRMAEATGTPASTIHRLLGWNFKTGTFLHHAGRPLKGEVFVVDEVSMVDLMLFASLLEALPVGCALVLIGDVDQLPSIGPGKVLSDLIESRCLPVYRLRKIFRQAGSSLIVRNAHRVRGGEMPLSTGTQQGTPGNSFDPDAPSGGTKADFFLTRQTDPLKAREMVVRLAAERLQARFGLDPMNDLQVITPMNKGACGTRELNKALQEALNPDGARIAFTGRSLRVGDRVMQVRNDYDKDVFNGDVGRIISFDSEMQTVTVDFDGRPVEYEALELDDLVIAYAVTVHKSQGSEYPAVILTLLNEHYIMLQRNLLYTAISRGKEVVVLVGDRQSVARAVKNNRERYRCTRLALRLRSIMMAS
ncbi:MAG: ATP-dependent RecD-like DNA helicase [Gemmatimonadota bacterium]|nr:ATP-dependent RecD-like DNA helicase [Gemmatimonadota bacterium]